MKINILLPHKEKFDKKKLSSVSITVLNNFNHSDYKKQIRIFGTKVKDPATPKNFIGVKNSLNIFKSKNFHLAKMMCLHVNNDIDDNQIIEIHNRPVLLNYVLNNLNKRYPINIFFHNNPLDMKGSKTLLERKMIVKNVHQIYCVSRYIKNKFLTGFNYIPSNVHVLYNGVERNLKKFPKKINEILFVGKLVEEKGIKLYVNALVNMAEKLPDWKFCIVGSTNIQGNKKALLASKTYENNL